MQNKVCDIIHNILVVLTHNPISDWKNDGTGNANCVYFNGHTHKNFYYNNFDKNSHIFADNQIGYKNSKIEFKKVFIYERVNPFAEYIDGYYEINTYDYFKFYEFVHDRIEGTKLIEKIMKEKKAHFYMIKKNGYYGFFLISKEYAYMCNGGCVKKIGKNIDINHLYKNFLNMIKCYVEPLEKYNNSIKKISKFVKSFGGDGKIHGCIVDIDFFNHIMLYPIDGTVTYYYSPEFGEVKTYENLISLLNEHEPKLAKKYLKNNNKKNKLEMILSESNFKNDNKITKIDISDSLYVISRRMMHIQRLLDKQILREWNEELLIKNNKNFIENKDNMNNEKTDLY